MSLYLALEEVLDPSTVYDDVFIVRSAVTTRDIGFLPGDEQEKKYQSMKLPTEQSVESFLV